MKNKNVLLGLGVFLIIYLFTLSNLFATQIEKTIDYSFGYKAVDFYGESKFTSQITFDPLPELLETTIVHVKIMAMCDLDFDPEYIVVTAYDNLIDFSQLTPKTWTPPIKEGDIYEGMFTITPTEIGQFSFHILPKAPQLKLKYRFRLYLTIDESGELVHLSSRVDHDHSGMVIHPPVVGDEISLKYRVFKHIDGSITDDFINVFNISPIPAFKETSTVRFELTANRECPEGVQFYFSWTENMELLDVPNSWVDEVNIGESHIDSFKIIPKTTGCGRLRFHAIAHSTPKGTTTSTKYHDKATERYVATFFIDESGKLTFIGREYLKSMREACQQYKSESYMSQPKVFTESKLKKKTEK